jgi:SET domain-containing protein
MFFRLKKSTIEEAGIGVFSTTYIKAGDKLITLFDESGVRWVPVEEFDKLNISAELKENFSIKFDEGYSMPADFNRICVGWYLNHSVNPNLHFNEEYEYFASRDIHPGEELFIDYGKL